MKITQDEVVERQTILHIELEDDDIDPYIARAYSKVVHRVNIPGFRKGKAPRRIIEQYFGRESLLNEVLDSMLPELTGQAITDTELDAVGLPSIDIEGFEPFQFSATVPLRPDVDLGEYREIRIEREEVSLPDNAVEERLEQLRLSVASWEPVQRAVKLGDMVSADIEGKIGDEAVIDEKDAVYLINEDIPRPFPGFSEKLVGLESERPTGFDLEIAEDFSDENIAGKTATFQVIVKDVKERILPELNDEFAQSIGEGYESLENLREEIDESIKNEAETESLRSYRESIVQALLECSNIELPPLLIDHEATHMLEEQERMVTQANMVLDDYLQSMGKSRGELEEEFKVEAIARLTRSFVLSTLTSEEEVEVSDEEIQDRIEELFADSDQEMPDSSQTDEMKDYLRRSMQMEKTMELLQNIAEGESEKVSKDDVKELSETNEQKKEDVGDTNAS